MCSADLYAYLRKEFINLDVFFNVDISYIKTIIGSDNKMIFLCKQDKSRMKTISLISPRNKLPDLQDEQNLTGSPLKDDCEIDFIDTSIDSKLATTNSWSDEEETYTGIPLDLAREILSNIALQKSLKSSAECMPVWVLCDPPMDGDSTILLQFNLNCDFNSRGLVQYRGLIAPGNINITNIVAEHNSYFKENKTFDIAFDNIFNIKSNIVLKISWTSSSLKPALNTLKDADVMLYETIGIEENNSVAEDYWQQLYILSIIRDTIIDYKENDDPTKEPDYTHGSNCDIEEIQGKIIALMTEVSTFEFEFESNSDDCDLHTVIQRAKTRKFFDITGLLWDVLKRCSCYKDLKAAFTTVFQCAAKFNIVNMPTNQNHLAEIIREVSQHRLAIPCLTGSEPLELLLEIGLGKLSKDYEYIFTESKICGANDLRIHKRDSIEKSDDVGLNVRKSLHNAVIPISSDKAIERKTLLHGNNRQPSANNDCVGFQNSRFSAADTEYKLSRLGQIHLTLEHLLLMQTNLNIDIAYNQICANLLKKPTISFNKLWKESVDKLEIPIVTNKILHELENKVPHARRISMISNNKFKKVQTTFYFSLDNIFPPNIFSNIDEKEMTRENLYHHWVYNHYSTNRS